MSRSIDGLAHEQCSCAVESRAYGVARNYHLSSTLMLKSVTATYTTSFPESKKLDTMLLLTNRTMFPGNLSSPPPPLVRCSANVVMNRSKKVYQMNDKRSATDGTRVC